MQFRSHLFYLISQTLDLLIWEAISHLPQGMAAPWQSSERDKISICKTLDLTT